MRFRLLNKIYARIFGYFWLPCPICKQMSGGHEWLDENTLMTSESEGKGVCKDCSTKVKELNKKFEGENKWK